MTTKTRKPVEHPLLPGEANTLLAVVVFLFATSGVLFLVAFTLLLVGKLVGWQAVEGIKVQPLAAVIALAVAAGYVATARLLAQRRRLGGILGVWFIALSFVGELVSLDPIGVGDVLWPAGLLVALALAWSHLSSEGSRSTDH